MYEKKNSCSRVFTTLQCSLRNLCDIYGGGHRSVYTGMLPDAVLVTRGNDLRHGICQLSARTKYVQCMYELSRTIDYVDICIYIVLDRDSAKVTSPPPIVNTRLLDYRGSEHWQFLAVSSVVTRPCEGVAVQKYQKHLFIKHDN